MSEMDIIDKAGELFKAKNCEKVLNLLASMSQAEFNEWIQSVDEVLSKRPVAKLDQIRLAKDYLEHHVNQLSNYEIDDEIDWFASINFNQDFNEQFTEALNRMEPLIGNQSEWNTIENEMHKKEGHLPGIVGKKESDRLLTKKIDYRRKKLIHVEVLEEIYPFWKLIRNELVPQKQLDQNLPNPSEKQLTTAKGRIEFIEEIYRLEGIDTYKEALGEAEEMIGRKLYSNVKSFQNARRNLRNRQKK